jgi:hypothetical protein
VTREEKIKALNDWCEHRGACDNTFEENECPLNMSDCINYNFEDMSDELIDCCYDKVFPEPIEEPTEQVNDIVNHPSHYTHGGMECIDEMITLFGKQVVMHFCLCNAWKYRKRCMYKNGEEDMKKSDWYIAKYKELADG